MRKATITLDEVSLSRVREYEVAATDTRSGYCRFKPHGVMALPGPFNSVAFSADPEQHYVYAGGMNATGRIFILRRSDLQMLGSFKSSGQHYMDADSKGNLFTCGRQMPQRWVLKELPERTER